MEGYLKKWTNLITRWKTRYVVVENEILKYYSKSKHTLKASYFLPNSVIETESIDSNDIVIKLLNGEILRFQTPNIEIKQKWINVLLKASIFKKEEREEHFDHSEQNPNIDNRERKTSNENNKVLEQTNKNTENEDRNKLHANTPDINLEDFKNTFLEILNEKLINGKSKINIYIEQSQTFLSSLDEKINALIIACEKMHNTNITLLSKQIIDIAANLKSTFLNSTLEIQETKECMINSIHLTFNTMEQILEIKKQIINSYEYLNQSQGKKLISKNVMIQVDIESEFPDVLHQSRNSDIEKEVQIASRFSDDIFVDAAEISSEFNRISIIEPILRTELPLKEPINTDFPLWNELKFFDFKNLTNLYLPIYFNEPLSMMQRLAETFENDFLLEKASLEEESLSRLIYVSLFTISQYNSLFMRLKKPFDSILGETYEYITDKFKLVAEKVSYDPPIIVIYVEGKTYNLRSETQIIYQLKNNNIEVIPKGEMTIYFPKFQETFVIIRPSILICNLTVGKLYLDIGNDAIIENQLTKEKTIITFHQKNCFEKAYGLCEGFVKDKKGVNRFEIKGKWFEFLCVTTLSSMESFKLWESTPRPKNFQNYFNFTLFALQLNYMSENLSKKLPPTDSRFRKDIRALESGNLKLANEYKKNLEEMEKEIIKDIKSKSKDYTPLYFDEYFDENNNRAYRFSGKYWKDRERLDWSNLPNLFSK